MSRPLLLQPNDLQHWDGVIVDTRPLPRYREGHLPGAVNLPQSVIRQQQGHATLIVDAHTFAERVGAVGVDAQIPVAAYSEKGQPDAGYFLWALSYYGHTDAHLLDGGIEHWQMMGLPLSTDPVEPNPKTFTPTVQQDLRAKVDWLSKNFGQPAVKILDNRSAAEYRGQDAYAQRGGHIPSAAHLEWTQMLNPDGTFKSESELRSIFSEAGLGNDQTAVIHCQTANRSGAVFVALRLIGHERVRVYDGSWSEWGNEPDLPVETDAE